MYKNKINGGIALGYIIVILINIINKFVLAHVAHQITHHQRHIHFSSFQYSFAMKYMLSMFFTTALMTLIVQAIDFNNFTRTLGVVQQQTFMFIFNAVFSPIMWLINPYYLTKYIKQKIHFGSKALTQKQANHIMQNPNYDMGKRYTQLMKTMCFTFLYIDIILVGAVFSFVGIIIYYVVDKYVLLRRSCVKESISSDLSKSMITVLQFTLVLKPIGQLIFAQQIRNQYHIASIVMIVIGVIYMLLPLQKILRYFFKQEFKHEQKTYEEVKDRFIENYFTCYPMRKHESHLKHISKGSIVFRTQLSLSNNKPNDYKSLKQFKKMDQKKNQLNESTQQLK